MSVQSPHSTPWAHTHQWHPSLKSPIPSSSDGHLWIIINRSTNSLIKAYNKRYWNIVQNTNRILLNTVWIQCIMTSLYKANHIHSLSITIALATYATHQHTFILLCSQCAAIQRSQPADTHTQLKLHTCWNERAGQAYTKHVSFLLLSAQTLWRVRALSHSHGP